MPSYDLARDRFRLAHAHLGVLGLLQTNQPVGDDLAPARDELVQIGLVSEEGEISPVLSDLAAVMSRPVVQVMVEMTGPQGITTHGMVVGQQAVFAFEEWPGAGELEYVQVEPATVVFELARVVGLRQRARAEARPAVLTVDSTMGALDAVFAALGAAGAQQHGQPGKEAPPRPEPEPAALAKIARQVLASAAPDMDDTSRAVFADLITQLRANWRMTVAWPSSGPGATDAQGKPTGTGVNSIAIWDCGPLGYWQREKPAEPIAEGQVTPQSELRLVQVSTKKVWKMIADLLPNRDEIRKDVP